MNEVTADPVGQDPRLLRRLLRAKDRMDAASHEAWPVTRLAHVSGVSAAHFARSFKRAFGVPPHHCYKVWPAEVEALMYRHPAIQEACVISAADARRGDTVKALVVLKPGHEVAEQQIIDWAHEHMAADKSPRNVQIVPSLPKSGSGKIMWRELQGRENQAAQAADSTGAEGPA